MRLLGFTAQELNENIKIYTTGCEASMSDAYNFARTLPPSERAIVFGTCSFIEDRSIESSVLTEIMKKVYPDHEIYAIGCDINLNKGKYHHCNHTVTNEEVTEKIKHESDQPCGVRKKGMYIEGLPIKVQDGCSNKCAYCVINQLRNKPHSIPYKELVRQVKEQISISPEYRLITLCGTEIANYYDPESGYKISDVLEHLVIDVPELKKINITAVDPAHPETEKIIRIIGSGKPQYLPYILLGVQAGCNKTLKRMNRRHNVARVRELHKLAKKLKVACGWDIIVGFPGETEEDFMETYSLLLELKPVSQNLFMYSDREGTPASKMPDKVPFEEIERRSRLIYDAMYSYFRDNYEFADAVLEFYTEDSSAVAIAQSDNQTKKNLLRMLEEDCPEKFVDIFNYDEVAEIIRRHPANTILHVKYDMDREVESEVILFYLTNQISELPIVVHAPASIKDKYDPKKFEEYFSCVLMVGV